MPFATVNGSRVHYLAAGPPPAGEAVVLLHAFPLHAGMWEEQMAALAPRWPVIAPDFPGFGQSDPLPNPATASLDAMVDAVTGLLSELRVDRVVLGGLSMGGYAAFVLARRHRSLLRALVLADTRAGADLPGVKERRTSQQAKVQEEGTAEVVESLLEALLSDATRERPETVDRIRGLMQDASPSAFVAALQAMKDRSDAVGELAGLDLPTLVVVGEHDKTAPVDVAQEMSAMLPDARLAVVPGAGHLSNLENPQAFNAELIKFLEGLDTP